MNQSGGLILLYHRVTTLDTDPQLLAVSPANFAAQMAALKRFARPIALAEMVSAARSGEDLNGAVAITFDDGYADNLLEAAPILRAANIPATVFVAGGGTDSNREFFWDELDRIFLQTNRLPRHLSIATDTFVYQAELGKWAEYSRDDWSKFGGWKMTMDEDPTSRQRVYRELCGLIHKSNVQLRCLALKQIQEWCGLGAKAHQSHRMMTSIELRKLGRGGLIEIGGHTLNHPLLAVESIENQSKEIMDGKSLLENNLGKAVRGFSYPFGGRHDYTSETIAIAKSSGFEYACSNFAGRVDSDTDLFQLPRVLVRDWPADEFLSRLFPHA